MPARLPSDPNPRKPNTEHAPRRTWRYVSTSSCANVGKVRFAEILCIPSGRHVFSTRCHPSPGPIVSSVKIDAAVVGTYVCYGVSLAMDSPQRTRRRQRCTAGSPRTRRCRSPPPRSLARSRSKNGRSAQHEEDGKHDHHVSEKATPPSAAKSTAGGKEHCRRCKAAKLWLGASTHTARQAPQARQDTVMK